MLRAQGPAGGLPPPTLTLKPTPGATTGNDGDHGSAESGATAATDSSSSGSSDEQTHQQVHSVDLSKPPGHFQLLFDEEAGFEYKSEKRLATETARKEAKKAAATASTTTADATATPATIAAAAST